MKFSQTFISIAALTVSTLTIAAPVQYQITATKVTETLWNGTQTVPVSSNFLFAPGTQIFATFFYDVSTAATSTNNPGTYDLNNYGLISYYTGSVTNLSGTVAGYTFSTSFADTIVADSATSNPNGRDGIFHQAGLVANPASPAYSSLNGFAIGDYTLVNITAYTAGLNTFLSDQSLPAVLASTALSNTGFNLNFLDSAGNYRTVIFGAGNIAPVPLPSSALFFLSGIIGLGTNAVRKLKR